MARSNPPYRPKFIYSIDTICFYRLQDYLPKCCSNEEMVQVFVRSAKDIYGIDHKAPYDVERLEIDLCYDPITCESPTKKVFEFKHPLLKLRKGRLSAQDLPEYTEFNDPTALYLKIVDKMPARVYADYVRLLYRYARNIGHTRYSTNFEFFTWCNDAVIRPDYISWLLDISKDAVKKLLELDIQYRQHRNQAKAFETLQTIQTKSMYMNAIEFEKALELNRPTLNSPSYYNSSQQSNYYNNYANSQKNNSSNKPSNVSANANHLTAVTAESIEKQFKEFLKKATQDVYKDIEMHSLAIVKRFLSVYNEYQPGISTKDDMQVANMLSQCLRTIHSIKLANQKSDERISQLEEELSALKTKALNQSQPDVTVKFVTKSNNKEEPTE